MERATGIEPASSVWKTEALPLSYARVTSNDAVPLTRGTGPGEGLVPSGPPGGGCIVCGRPY
jgi:hypothetical protein